MVIWQRWCLIKEITPDRFYIRQSDRKDVKKLLESKDSPLLGRDNKELFIMAMVLGFREGEKIPLDKKWGFFRTEYLTDKEGSIIKAIAIADDGDLNVLLDKKKVYNIAEEYAACGIKMLKKQVFSGGFGSYVKKLESDLVDEFKKSVQKI